MGRKLYQKIKSNQVKKGYEKLTLRSIHDAGGRGGGSGEGHGVGGGLPVWNAGSSLAHSHSSLSGILQLSLCPC